MSSVFFFKCGFNFYFFLVFEEKGILDNQAVPFNGEVISEEYTPNINTDSNKRVIIASRHLRNDSKSIQLEYR